MKLNWNFQRGRGRVVKREPSMEEVYIFSGTVLLESYKLHVFPQVVISDV